MKYIIQYCDITINDFLILGILSFIMIFIGLNSQLIFDIISPHQNYAVYY
jgi:hypothetical protein